MLIRIETGELIEFPEDLAALVLIDPLSDGDDQPIFTAEEVNLLLHSIVGTHYDPELSREDNIKEIEELYGQFKPPSAQTLRLAQQSIRAYVREIKRDEIGMVNREQVDQMFVDNPQKRLG
ncbi:hypothetical protein [Microbulbifer sp. 2205BS26-8]|uniref:hypothetical protein n=1 Tax=Microbulbifer sp. 2205BS26-8 TaxID=3064386 RepID=UPI00273E0CDB|nr:hypothetical protein [Microbulbifer sp. 2205BS26-8]MDP5209449.1 hypothetical protein [Microbulbifer sp. 2205BS26-8]